MDYFWVIIYKSSNTTLNQSSAEHSNDSTKVKDAREEDKQKQETTVPKQIGNMIWVVVVLVALVALVVVGWLIYKKRNKQS